MFIFLMVCGQNLRVPAKVRRDLSNGCRVIASFRFPIWQLSAILDFYYMKMFTFRTVCGHDLHVPAKFRRDWLNDFGVNASF